MPTHTENHLLPPGKFYKQFILILSIKKVIKIRILNIISIHSCSSKQIFPVGYFPVPLINLFSLNKIVPRASKCLLNLKMKTDADAKSSPHNFFRFLITCFCDNSFALCKGEKRKILNKKSH